MASSARRNCFATCSLSSVSPLSPFGSATDSDNQIIEITELAHTKLVALRDEEPDSADLGLRLEIISGPGEPFRYDLAFETVTKAALNEEVRTIDGLKIIVPIKDIEFLNGSTLDFADASGFVMRNPNKPAPFEINIEGLVKGDELSAAVEAVIAVDVNPMLASHGGYVSYVGHNGEGIVYTSMGGGCQGCSMSKMTMMTGVESKIIEMVPDVSKVVDVTDHASGTNPYLS